ncbi:MAG TPA: type I polyketide synthase, partial [Solirubrobacterales bacterium]|nr:type I polyketide synthase [Solirubrobacterales bacterium]
MTDTAGDDKLLPHLRRVMVELQETRTQLQGLERRQHEPIAIVGMSCRYPGGVSSPEELWDLVAAGRDAIGEFPANRGWPLERLYNPDPDSPGTSYARHGGFLYEAGEFDAAFFGISPREALAMDPQQRLLLEGAWEAFEDAGIDPASLRGSQTGVFAGVMYHDYVVGSQLRAADHEILGGYLGTGTAGSVASGRLAYAFGLEGPAVSVDTACSSSLIAIHLACQELRSGECEMALAGGVSVMATPTTFIDFSRQRGLAPDGRCKSFGAGADGTGWGEGVGLVLLERLSEARRKGRRVLGLIRGSAVNQDGASNGLTAPNGPSQERVIAQALADAGLAPQDIDAVEAHGTGTPLGDPIEAQALLATYGKERANGPLRLGSIKSNIGHTQAAAGVAGVIKTIQALEHELLPPTLHAEQPSEHVDWSEGAVELLNEPQSWPADDRPRRAGVSSFGVSGTNAHLILEEAPAADPSVVDRNGGDPDESSTPALTETTLPWLLSAKTEPALRETASRLAAHLSANPELKTADIGNALAGRSAFEHRAALVGGDRQGLVKALSALATEERTDGLLRSTARTAGPIVFMFPGQGGQWAGMALELIERSPVFAKKIAECEAALSEHLQGFSIEEALRGEGEDLDRLDVVQPALFSIMVSLVELWRSLGVTPDVVIGHSQGEIVAAHVAGGLSLKDAARVVALRSRALVSIAGKGAMASVAASAEEIAPLIESYGNRLSLAAINGPTSTVISGEPGALKELLATCEREGKRTRTLPVDCASHSVQVEQIEEELIEAFEPIEPRSGQIAFHSTLTGSQLDTAELDASYWYRNMRETVRFEQVIRELIKAGHRTFLELSPHPVLTVGLAECVEAELEDPDAALITGSLRRDEGGPERFLTSAAELWTKGAEIDWKSAFEATGAKPTSLPTYPFQRERYWFGYRAGAGDMAAAGLGKSGHPLLGATVPLAQGEGALFTGRISLQSHPWLADHAVLGAVLIPGAAFLELALHAGAELGCELLEELVVESPLVLEEQGAVQIQLALGDPDEEDRRPFSIHSRPEATEGEEPEWTRHASGYLAQAKEESSAQRQQAASLTGTWPPEGAEPLEVADLYERLADAGLEYGPAFQGLNAAYRRGEELFAELSLAEQESSRASAFGIHPALLDSAFHAVGFDLQDKANPSLPFAFTGARLYASGASSLRLCLSAQDSNEISLALADESGALVFGLDSLSAREVSPAQLGAARDPHRDSLFALRWSPAPQTPLAQGLPQPQLLDCTEAAQPEQAHQIAAHALAQIQAHLADEDAAGSRLTVLTKEAVAAKEGDQLTGLASSVLWGLVRSAQSEHPGRIALIDTDGSAASVEVLEEALRSGEPQLAIRAGGLLAPRLHRAQAPEEQESTQSFDPERTTLITGATGTLGSLVARHLVEAHGARHLLLASRQGPEAEGAAELKEELEAIGATVEIVACDVSDRSQLEALLATVSDEQPLGAVIHAAGALDDATIASLDPERLQRVFAPKLDAAWHLHELTEQIELSEFVLFSSAAATLGSPGQGNYAAANAFLDSLAAYRQAKGLPANSIAWGLWEEASALTETADRERLSRAGIEAISSQEGLDLFDASLATGESFALAAPLDRGTLRAAAKAGLLSPLLADLLRVPTRRSSGRDGLLARRLAETPEAERRALVLELVSAEIAAVLGHSSADAIDSESSFKDLGFDSLSAVELRNRLNALSGLSLPATMVFDYPTPAGIAEYLLGELSGAKASSALPAISVRPSEEPIAIVGMSCRYPGGVSSPEELWDLVAQGRDAIDEFPADRDWDVERLYDPDPDSPGTSYARHGGFLYEAGEFDAAFFGISPREALAMDPQQRLLLEGAWEAFEDAGIDPTSLRGSQTGVFAGVMYHDYALFPEARPAELDGYLGTGGSLVSGRLSYSFGFEGPAISVDTACSSSLVAMHLACQALRQGECDRALAGGVTVIYSPAVFTTFSRQRGLSPDGRCKSFGAGADGAGWGEGVGLVLLERLSEARRKGHRVLGLIRGSAVNQDGASNGLTAPNGPSQERVIAQALADAGLTPQDIDAVEAHGTGTPLGDPIEAQALLATYGKERANGPLRLGSIKSNIGHTQAAAGVAGVIKTIQALEHELLPPTLHAEQPSEHVDWSEGAVELLNEPQSWPLGDRPRRAGVSSFGVSGTNAHLILEEAPAADPSPSEGGEDPKSPAPPLTETTLPWLLSAKTEP